jgi:two-component system sensor kinase FixL
MVEISVRDTGPGIPESVLSRMYQPFTSTKGGGGMGIGLSICRRIVQAHGGTLQAENGPDGGACFRFTLPSIGQEELQA